MTTYINPMNDIAPALGNIADAVATAINPLHKLQLATRDAIVKDPELAQRLADLEDSSPGTLETLGLGSVGKAIAKIPPTQAQIIRRNIAPAIEQMSKPDTKTGQSAATQAVTGKTPEENTIEGGKAAVAQSVIDVIKTDPNVAKIAGTVGATGQTPDQATMSAINVKSAKDAEAFLAANPDKGIPQIVQNIFDGTISMQDAASLFNSPWGESLKAYMNAMLTREEFANRVRVAQARGPNELNDAMARLKLQQAFNLYQDIGNAGSLNDSYNYLFNPAFKKMVDDLVANPSKATTPEQKAMLQFGQGLANYSITLRRKQAGVAYQAIVDRVAKENIMKDDPEMIKANTAAIQDQLNILAESSGIQLKTEYGKIPHSGWFGSNFARDVGRYYTDSYKVPVNADVIFSGLTQFDRELVHDLPDIYQTYQTELKSLKPGESNAKVLNTLPIEVQTLLRIVYGVKADATNENTNSTGSATNTDSTATKSK